MEKEISKRKIMEIYSNTIIDDDDKLYMNIDFYFVNDEGPYPIKEIARKLKHEIYVQMSLDAEKFIKLFEEKNFSTVGIGRTIGAGNNE